MEAPKMFQVHSDLYEQLNGVLGYPPFYNIATSDPAYELYEVYTKFASKSIEGLELRDVEDLHSTLISNNYGGIKIDGFRYELYLTQHGKDTLLAVIEALSNIETVKRHLSVIKHHA